MFPISDEADPTAGPPVITILLILANIAVFVFLQGLGTTTRSRMLFRWCRTNSIRE